MTIKYIIILLCIYEKRGSFLYAIYKIRKEGKMKEKRVKKNLFLTGLIVFLNNVCLYNVVAILYFKELTNSFVLAMSVFAIATISTAAFEIPTGILSDKIGRKKTIVFGSVCSVLGAITLFLAKNYYFLVLFAIINGIERAFFSGNNDAYVYENLKMINIEKYYIGFIGKIKSMGYLAGAFSGLVGAVLLYFFSYKLIITVSIIPKVLQLITSFLLGEIEKTKTKTISKLESLKRPIKEVFKNKLLLKKVVFDGIMESTNESCFQFRSAFYETVWPMWAIGIPGILANVGAFVSNWFSGKIIKKVSRKKYWIFGQFYSVIANVLAVLINNVISPIVMVSNSLFHSDFLNSEIEQKLFKDEIRASMGSVKSFIQSVLFSIFSVLLGIIADCFGVVTSFVIFQLINIVPIILNSKIIEKVEKEY